MTVPASSTLSVTVPSGGALLFAGTMTVEYTPSSDYTPIVIAGSNAKVAGLAGAVIDGQGSQYWDGEGSNGGSSKPDKFIALKDVDNLTFEQLTIQNWPTHLFSLSGTGLTINNLILDNSAGDETDSSGDALGHNTDAFDISSMDTLHVYDVTVYNQDDCVAVNDGSNMLFENMYCSGGHGLSIGSIKTGKTVSNVTFQDSSVVNSENACRIKTYDTATDASVSDITYSGITVSGITEYVILPCWKNVIFSTILLTSSAATPSMFNRTTRTAALLVPLVTVLASVVSLLRTLRAQRAVLRLITTMSSVDPVAAQTSPGPISVLPVGRSPARRVAPSAPPKTAARKYHGKMKWWSLEELLVFSLSPVHNIA